MIPPLLTFRVTCTSITALLYLEIIFDFVFTDFETVKILKTQTNFLLFCKEIKLAKNGPP